jgi:hypothetical protein
MPLFSVQHMCLVQNFMFSGRFRPAKPLTSYSKWVDSITHICGNGYRRIGG